MIRLGGQVFVKTQDPEALARAHVEAGYRAAYCPDVTLEDADRVRAIREAFARADVVIAEVGAWRNMIPPAEATRRKNLAYVSERLALADAVGALCCVDYAGARRDDVDWGPHPDNFTPETFDLIVETVREVLDEVKPGRARFCLEMMQTCPPDSVDNYLELIRAIDRPAFAVHLDPVNIFYAPRTCSRSGRLVRDCIQRLGPWIVSCHAKDFVVRDGLALHIDEVPPGAGLLDYPAYVEALSGLERDVPLMIEHLKGEEAYRKAADFIRSVMGEAGSH